MDVSLDLFHRHGGCQSAGEQGHQKDATEHPAQSDQAAHHARDMFIVAPAGNHRGDAPPRRLPDAGEIAAGKGFRVAAAFKPPEQVAGDQRQPNHQSGELEQIPRQKSPSRSQPAGGRFVGHGDAQAGMEYRMGEINHLLPLPREGQRPQQHIDLLCRHRLDGYLQRRLPHILGGHPDALCHLLPEGDRHACRFAVLIGHRRGDGRHAHAPHLRSSLSGRRRRPGGEQPERQAAAEEFRGAAAAEPRDACRHQHDPACQGRDRQRHRTGRQLRSRSRCHLPQAFGQATASFPRKHKQ